jgi:DNA-binding CsgD family transcriptional regulator
MFETINRVGPGLATAAPPPPPPTDSAIAHCLRQTFDEIDYGIVLVGSDAHVLYVNHAARVELDRDHPLQLLGQSLRAGRPQDVAPLFDALSAAQRGLRRLVALGTGEHRITVSVVPLAAAPDGTRVTLLMLGKRQVCEQLSVHGFARTLGLTPAETRVLERLWAGAKPGLIAKEQQVAISTVRTQISSIRAKAGAESIRALLRQVAVLPPLVGALRNTAAVMLGAVALG